MAFWKKPEDERDPLGDKLVKPKSTGSSTRDYWMSGDRDPSQSRASFIAAPAQPRRPETASAPTAASAETDVLEPPPAPPPALPEAPDTSGATSANTLTPLEPIEEITPLEPTPAPELPVDPPELSVEPVPPAPELPETPAMPEAPVLDAAPEVIESAPEAPPQTPEIPSPVLEETPMTADAGTSAYQPEEDTPEPPVETVIETQPPSPSGASHSSNGALALKTEHLPEDDPAPVEQLTETAPDPVDLDTSLDDQSTESDEDNIIDFRARQGDKHAATAPPEAPAVDIVPDADDEPLEADAQPEDETDVDETEPATPLVAEAESRPVVAPRVVIGEPEDQSHQFDTGDTDYDYVAEADENEDWSRKGDDDYVYAEDISEDQTADSGYYIPPAGNGASQQNNPNRSGNRRAALYLAGAASITAICAAVYYLLPHDIEAPVEPQFTDRAPSDADTIVASVASVDPLDTADVSQTTTGLDDATVIGDLEVTSTDTGNDVISVPSTELFAETESVAAPTTTSTTRELAPSNTSLSSPDTRAPDSVTEAAPRFKLETSSATPSAPEPAVSAPSLRPETPASPDASTDLAAADATPSISVSSVAPVTTTSSDVATPLREIARSTLRTPMPSFTGDIRADSVASMLWSQYGGAGGEEARRTFAGKVQRAFETTPVGQSVGISSPSGEQMKLEFLSDISGARPLEINRAADLTPIGQGFAVESGWFVTSSRANLRKSPDLQSNDIRTVLPKNALVQSMGVLTTQTGDRWQVIGQDGVAIGYLHTSVATPYAIASNPPAGQWRTATPAQATDYVTGSAPCRSFAASGGSGNMSGTGCLSGSGQWLTSAPSTANAGPSTTARIYSATATQPVARTSETTSRVVQASSFTSTPAIDTARLGAMSRDVADILFNPGAARRASRHGDQLTETQIDRVFSTGQTLSVAGNSQGARSIIVNDAAPISHVQEVRRTTAIPALPAQMSLDTHFARTNGELRLMTNPDGRVANAPVQPFGSILQVLGEVQSNYGDGDTWSLVGRDDVGYGFVRSSYLSQVGGSPSVTSLPKAASVADSVAVASQCRQATYVTPASNRTITACVSADGHWNVVERSAPSYSAQTVASLN